MDTIGEIEALINSEMADAHSWYADHVKSPRLLFRLLGLATIFLSVIIPFISHDSVELANKMLWITGLSLSITVVTGISTFFRPDETWKLNMGAKLNLEALYATWKLDMLEAKSRVDEPEALKQSFDASRKFLRAAQQVTSANTESFFANVSFPENE